MAFLDLVRRRRSIRSYRPDPVPRPVLDVCLEAVRLAPSACNSQPWQFIVVDEPSLKASLAEAAFSGIYSMNAFAAQAPVLVAVVRESSKYTARLGGLFRGIPFNLMDIGISVEHFCLQATEAGLGTCWLGWFNEREVRRVLGLGRRTGIATMLSVGYPAYQPGSDSPRKPTTECRRYNNEAG